MLITYRCEVRTPHQRGSPLPRRLLALTDETLRNRPPPAGAKLFKTIIRQALTSEKKTYSAPTGRIKLLRHYSLMHLNSAPSASEDHPSTTIARLVNTKHYVAG